MKRYLTIFVVMVTMVFMLGFSSVAFAIDDICVDHNSVAGIVGDKNHHNVVNSGPISIGTTGDITNAGGAGGAGYGGDAIIKKGAVKVKNKNEQGQEQDQKQKQKQDQEQSQQNALGLNDVGNIKDSFNSAPARGFAIPGEVNYGPLINYYGKPLPSSGFQMVEDLIMYGSWFTEGALESMLDGVEKVECEFKLANQNILVPAVKADKNGVRWIKVIVSKEKVAGGILVGYATARSGHAKTTMTEVMAEAALKALNNSCNVIHFKVQGAVRDTQSFGWGIGFNTTAASINDSGQHSSITSGGFGLVVPGLESPVSVAKVPDQTGNHRLEKKAEKKVELKKTEKKTIVKLPVEEKQTGNHIFEKKS